MNQGLFEVVARRLKAVETCFDYPATNATNATRAVPLVV